MAQTAISQEDPLIAQPDLPSLRSEWENKLRSVPAHPASPEQIELLTRQQNRAEDWSNVLISPGADLSEVWDSSFEGVVTLVGAIQDSPRSDRPVIQNSVLRDSLVSLDSRIFRCALIERTVICPGARLENVGRVALTRTVSEFGNELILFEKDLYSRRIDLVAESLFDDVVRATGPAPDSHNSQGSLAPDPKTYRESISSAFAFIGPNVSIRDTPKIEDAFLADHVEIDAAGAITNSTLWGAEEFPVQVCDGAQVHDSLVGPGCDIRENAVVRSSMLFENVQVGHHAIVAHSAIGAHSQLAASETRDSLIGPLTTAIHHGLTLAAWWPEGRGKIAYGANVGSNHTGRAPDQEIWPGEGVFYGLGCSIKFPANYREAPYTIIAAGVVALPQRIRFPFSLISQPEDHQPEYSPGYNQIRPGWGLLHNAYGLERMERNIQARFQARRCAPDLRIFREQIIAHCDRAIDDLSIEADLQKAIYSENEIDGLGKNVMTEDSRVEGINAYEWVVRLGAARTILSVLETESKSDPSAIQMAIERLGQRDRRALLEEIFRIESHWIHLVRQSRSRDQRRGAKILDDYTERHSSVENDPIIRAVESDLHRRRESATQLLDALQALGMP